MHGQRPFELSQEEIRNVRRYLEHGGVLFVDACCGSPKFDSSFRKLMKQMFPDIPLERIPVDHELFTSGIGHDLKSVRRRAPLNDQGKGVLKPVERSGPPFLEGINKRTLRGHLQQIRYLLCAGKADFAFLYRLRSAGCRENRDQCCPLLRPAGCCAGTAR